MNVFSRIKHNNSPFSAKPAKPVSSEKYQNFQCSYLDFLKSIFFNPSNNLGGFGTDVVRSLSNAANSLYQNKIHKKYKHDNLN